MKDSDKIPFFIKVWVGFCYFSYFLFEFGFMALTLKEAYSPTFHVVWPPIWSHLWNFLNLFVEIHVVIKPAGAEVAFLEHRSFCTLVLITFFIVNVILSWFFTLAPSLVIILIYGFLVHCVCILYTGYILNHYVILSTKFFIILKYLTYNDKLQIFNTILKTKYPNIDLTKVSFDFVYSSIENVQDYEKIVKAIEAYLWLINHIS